MRVNYSCDGSGAGGNDAICRAETDSTGKIERLTGGTAAQGWIFTPSTLKDTTVVEGVVPDPDYLSFGYWLQETVKDGKTTYGVSTFFGGKQAYSITESTTAGDSNYQQGSMSQLTGKATYEGDATGLFVKETFTVGDDGGVVSTPTSSGQFTAYAKLEARFGGTEYGNASNFEIDGNVTNFKDSNGAMIDDNWSVELIDAAFAGTGTTDGYISAGGDGAQDTYVNIFKGVTEGDKGEFAGEWNGGFFGNPGFDKDTATDTNNDGVLDNFPAADKVDNYPNSVAGEFTGHFSNGAVIGAFGASR